MHTIDGIAYAGDHAPMIKVSGVRPLDDYMLWVRFSTGEAKIFDFKPLLSRHAFAPLINKEVFKSVYIDCGITVWSGGEIDIAPETLYTKGQLVKDKEAAERWKNG